MNENHWYVYKHTCPDGRVYIGITSWLPTARWDGGIGYQHSTWEFFRYILATGWDNIEHEVLYSGLNEKEARRLEKLEILKHGKRVFNRVHADKVMRAIPVKVGSVLAKLTKDELNAVDLWCEALYGEITEENRYLVYRASYWERTVFEFTSGDPERIERELEFIEKRRRA